jgi:sialate O-acetylesterase
MDAFTTIATRTGVPVANTSAVFQQRIYNMNVNTNVTGVTTGTGITTGNIEFWHHCYEQATGLGGIGGSSTLYDFNDSTGTQPGSCYGSMQVHNYGTAQTIFAWNRWDYAGGGRMILASATPPADIQTGLSGTTQTATPPAP